MSSSPVLCSFGDCEARATHYPEVNVWAVGHKRGSHPPAKACAALPLCVEHAKDPSAPWLTEKGKELVAHQIRTSLKAEPDWSTQDVRAISIKHGAHEHPRHARGALPHEFERDVGGKPVCRWCKRPKSWDMHSAGPGE